MNERLVEEPKGVILLVDDDEQVLRAHTRVLARAGYAIETASDGVEAIEKVGRGGIDAIVSDISMPRMDGIGLLRAVRELSLDLPLIFITGAASLETAIQAVHSGALRYLTKPIAIEVLEREVRHAVGLHTWAKLRRAAHEQVGGDPLEAGDRVGMTTRFERALRSAWIAYQPIVSCTRRQVHSYEALLRSNEESLPLPEAVLRAAERLDRCADLGRTVRGLVAASLDEAHPATTVFVNVHPRELLDDSLYDRASPLGAHAKDVVLQITERAALEEISEIRSCVARLRSAGYRIGVDHLGSGYSSVNSLAQLEPDVVKLDAQMIRDVHERPVKQKLVGSFLLLGKDMGMEVIAEGVENEKERDELRRLGCDLQQGYFFARPTRGFRPVEWR